MAWIEPKTDWTVKDFFNASDYNRIIGNLKFLQDFSLHMFKKIEFADLGAEKDYESFIYAREVNNIENNLETLNLASYKLSIGNKTVYRDNGNTPLFGEFNRLESAMLKLYNMMQAHYGSLARLSFTLGGQKGFKV